MIQHNCKNVLVCGAIRLGLLNVIMTNVVKLNVAAPNEVLKRKAKAYKGN